MLLFLPFLSVSAHASMADDLEDLTRKFSNLKVFEFPTEHKQNSGERYEQKIGITDEMSFKAFLAKNASFRAIMTLPQIQKTRIAGGYEAMVDDPIDLRDRGQGVPSFLSFDVKHNTPFYKTTTSIVNCVCVVFDQYHSAPYQNGLMHVDDQHFNTGCFEGLVDRFDAHHRPNTKVTLTSCYFSPLLDRIYQLLIKKGFTQYEVDIANAYHSDTMRIMPAQMMGMTMSDVQSMKSLMDLQQHSTNPEAMPTFVMYDFFTHQHYTPGLLKNAQNNAFLEEYCQLYKAKKQEFENIVGWALQLLSGNGAALTENEKGAALKFLSTKTKEEVMSLVRSRARTSK
ncbi:MAG: hypothetical protein ACTHJ4_04925, partial [Candidatus Nucleicultricaceae bacterium]